MGNITVYAQYISHHPSLFVRTVDVRHPRAQMLFLHASAVHSDFYLPMAIQLAEAGIRVWLPDLRGHGRSEGRKGHIGHFETYRDDLIGIWEHFVSSAPEDIPSVLGGESLGGLVALLAAQGLVHPDGLFLVSPALSLHFQLSPAVMGILWRLQPVVGWIRPLKPLSMAGSTKSHEVMDLISRDPLVNRYYSLGFLLNLLYAQHLLVHPEKLQCASLALFSHEDPIVDTKRSAECMDKAFQHHNEFMDHTLHSLIADAPDRVVSRFLQWSKDHLISVTSANF
ncbi:MAG: hypothetical protein C7B46_18780 [Sulfobacillus benefaciens]|uniref:Serine aminopeptidase S33 domain-containing protein n=1 Tax=Sulfobacillus benefaciens TaxID=453960 RepID=A0A2T2X3P3_9FIRM|nr:MAG: hypothetical protein C7B46_18780 [Sulfobacillus benefaciens]